MSRYVLKIYNGKLEKIEEFKEIDQATYSFQKLLSNNQEKTMVVLFDNYKNMVIRIATFKDNEVLQSLNDSDIVKFEKNFCESGEDRYLYIVNNIDEHYRRCLITCINSGGFIPVSETVDLEMLEVVSNNN